MWLDIAKGALLLFVIGGAIFYITAVVRKSRAAGSEKFKNPYFRPIAWAAATARVGQLG